MTRLAAAFSSLAIAAIGLAACSELPRILPSSKPAASNSPQPRIGFSQFPDLPIPSGAKMDLDRSLVLGSRDAWIGRLAMKIDRNATSIYDFYSREMVKFGWREITSVRSEVSVLSYEQAGRVATLQIREARFGRAEIDITISPRGKPPQPMGPPEPPPFK